jgi:shikimate kinase
MYNQHLFLIGFMGCGKSYWGKQVAEYTRRPFIDLDQQIESGERKSISAIFASLDEEGFRKLERQYLQQLNEETMSIVATGGGTPCFFDNMAQMKIQGKTIFLDVPEPVLFRRLATERSKRPLLHGLDDEALMTFIYERMATRRPFYEQADVRIKWHEDPEVYRTYLFEAVQAL